MTDLANLVDLLRKFQDGGELRIGATFAVAIIADYDALKAKAEPGEMPVTFKGIPVVFDSTLSADDICLTPREAWTVANGQDNRWRKWGDSGPEWTDDRNAALHFARRQDAEAFARDDEDAWGIRPIGLRPEQPAIDLEQFREAVDLLRLVSLDGKRDCERHNTHPHDFGRSLEKADRLLAIIDGAKAGRTEGEECHKLDTDTHVFFYEQDFYVLSNFSSFSLQWDGWRFDTSEAAYHYEKFKFHAPDICDMVRTAPSAHEAFKVAERNKHLRDPNWDSVKRFVMRGILREKAAQHEYVRRKLLATGDRILVEDSWRDDYWGWGPNKDGQNMLGKLWMEVREELRAAGAAPSETGGVA